MLLVRVLNRFGVDRFKVKLESDIIGDLDNWVNRCLYPGSEEKGLGEIYFG